MSSSVTPSRTQVGSRPGTPELPTNPPARPSRATLRTRPQDRRASTTTGAWGGVGPEAVRATTSTGSRTISNSSTTHPSSGAERPASARSPPAATTKPARASSRPTVGGATSITVVATSATTLGSPGPSGPHPEARRATANRAGRGRIGERVRVVEAGAAGPVPVINRR